ncbi:MAG: menaquinol oxidoreductase [Thermodesulfobacteria bacterium]|nr:menaquinol oxidoreductase [Thermodesulfobacteriota bacterium]
MNVVGSFLIFVILLLIPWIGVGALHLNALFGIVIPYCAFLIFMVGLIWRMINWARSPQPFKIPTTCGQQKSLSWIKYSRLESPFTTFDVILRMFFEVVFFRSLFRNLKAELQGKRLIYGSSKWLWLGAILFHWSFFIILIRHLRFFTNPVPSIVSGLDFIDSFVHSFGVPPVFITDILILAGLTFLLLRRLIDPKVSYISHGSDYFPLFLLLGIVSTGVLMRYALKVDIYGIKHLTLGLISLHPTIPQDVGTIFYIHLFLVSCLAAYFPFSKLVHMVGVFFSPTRNMANNNRAVRHVNPWDYPVKYTTYCEWQERFRDLLEQAGLPIDEEWCKDQQTQKTQG